MENKIWHIDDLVYCQQITADFLEEALNFIDTVFYPYESFCSSVGVAKDPDALQELRDLTTTTAYDGVTLIAVDKSTNKIVGASFNKLQVRDNPVFENFEKSWKQPKSKYVVEFMAAVDNLCNLYDHCQADCIFEIMYLAVSPDYKRRSIGKKLVEFSLEIATNLANGVNVKKPIDDTTLSLEVRPRIVSAIFTSFITQKIGRQLRFEIAAELDYNAMDFHGVDFSNVLKNGTRKVTLEYIKL